MTPIERLIALDYVKKRIDAEIKRLRPDVEAHFHDRMTHEIGRDGKPKKSFGYYSDGEKLCAFWFPETKGEDERDEVTVTCYNAQAALEDDNDEWAEWLGDYIKKHIVELAERYVRETGDQLDGVAVETHHVDAVPPHTNGMQFRINQERIRRKMQPQLPAVVIGLLEGGRS